MFENSVILVSKSEIQILELSSILDETLPEYESLNMISIDIKWPVGLGEDQEMEEREDNEDMDDDEDLYIANSE